jgi:hypothetical protein
MNPLIRSAALVCLALNLPVAKGQSQLPAEVAFQKSLTPEELKHRYLACDAAATMSRLPMLDAVQCSIVSEELRLRVFGGDFDKLLAWWRTQRREPDGRTAP